MARVGKLAGIEREGDEFAGDRLQPNLTEKRIMKTVVKIAK